MAHAPDNTSDITSNEYNLAESEEQLWLKDFHLQTNQLEMNSLNKQEKVAACCPDEINIQMDDLEFKVREVESLIVRYIERGTIQVNENRKVQDLIGKYSVKLDSIDFMGREEGLTTLKIGLIERILIIQKKLKSLKIENKSKILPQGKLILEVKDGKLSLCHSVIENIIQLCYKNNDKFCYYGLVSIVGERNSGKSRLFQFITQQAQESNWKVLTPVIESGERMSSGIFCSALSTHSEGNRVVIFLMDIICDEYVNSQIYTKLIDFCILSSTVVFYTESEKELSPMDYSSDCYWDVQSSLLTTSHSVRQDFPPPYLFIRSVELDFLNLGHKCLIQCREGRIAQRKKENVAFQQNNQQQAALYLQNFKKIEFLKAVARRSEDFNDLGKIINKFKVVCSTIEASTCWVEPNLDSNTENNPTFVPPTTTAETSKLNTNNIQLKAAVRAAIQKYDNYMINKIGQLIFTDYEIISFHDKAMNILTAKNIFPELEVNIRKHYFEMVNDQLEERKHNLIIRNQLRIADKVKARKLIVKEVVLMYKELLSRYPASDTNTHAEFQPVVQSFTWKVYKKKAMEYYLSTCKVWKEALRSVQNTHNENITTHISQRKLPIGCSQKTFMMQFRKLKLTVGDESSVSLSFHLTPSSLNVAVYMTEPLQSDSNPPIFTKFWEPYIQFCPQGKSLIGSEATTLFQGKPCSTASSQSKSQYEQRNNQGNVGFYIYGMLWDAPKLSTSVYVNNTEETLGVEEILAMFFVKIKRLIEAELHFNFKSCVFALSPYFGTTARRMIQTALSLAGFSNSFLIESLAAADIGGQVLAQDYGTGQLLFFYDQHEVIQMCTSSTRDHIIEVKTCGYIMDKTRRLPLDSITMGISNSGKERPDELIKIDQSLTSATIIPMSPVLEACSTNETERLIPGALFQLKKKYSEFTFPHNIIKCHQKHDVVLLGAHLYKLRECAGIKNVRINKPNSFDMYLGINYGLKESEKTFHFPSEGFLLNINGGEKVCIFERNVQKDDTSQIVASLALLNISDGKKTIYLYFNSEGLLELSLNPPDHHEVGEEELTKYFQIDANYLLPAQIEVARKTLSKYFKTRKIKIENSWESFLKRTELVQT